MRHSFHTPHADTSIYCERHKATADFQVGHCHPAIEARDDRFAIEILNHRLASHLNLSTGNIDLFEDKTCLNETF